MIASFVKSLKFVYQSSRIQKWKSSQPSKKHNFRKDFIPK